MDDLRTFYWPDEKRLPIHGTAANLDDLKSRFNYLFYKNEKSPSYFVPSLRLLKLNPIRMNLGGIDIKIITQHHGRVTSLGFVFDEKGWIFN